MTKINITGFNPSNYGLVMGSHGAPITVPTFFDGVVSVIQIHSNIIDTDDKLSDEQLDKKAIYSDWETLGKDFQSVIIAYGSI